MTLGLLVALEALAGIVWGGGLRSFPAYFSQLGVVVGKHRLAFSHFDVYVMVAIAVVLVVLVVLFPLHHARACACAPARSPPRWPVFSACGSGACSRWGGRWPGVVGALAGVLVAPKLLLSPNYMDAVFVYGFTARCRGWP